MNKEKCEKYYAELSKESIAFSNIMSSPQDAIIEREIIKAFRCKTILELGAGTGAWCAWINSQIDNLTYYITEDFSYVTKKNLQKYIRESNDIKWPSNPTELNTCIEVLTENNSINYTLFTEDFYDIKHQIPHLIDYARIDCDTKNMRDTIKYLIEHGSENLIIVLDDCRPNTAIGRLLTLSEFIHSGELRTIWSGFDRMAFCRTSYNSKPVIEKIKNGNILSTYVNSYIWDSYKIAREPQWMLVTK